MRASTPVTLAACAALLMTLTLAGPALADDSPAVPTVVKIHADWCGTCTRLDPVWQQLRTEHGDAARWVVLDVTDRKRLAAASAEAERLGIRSFFEAYRARTGTIAVLHPTTGEPVRVFKGEMDPAAYGPAVREAKNGSPS